MTPSLVERKHQLPPGPLPQRLLSNQNLQLGDHLLRTSEREPGVDPVGYRRGTSLLEPADLGLREPVETEIRKCLSAPEIECFGEHALRAGGVTGLEQAPALGRKPLEATRVELIRFDPQEVAGGGRQNSLRQAGLASVRCRSEPSWPRSRAAAPPIDHRSADPPKPADSRSPAETRASRSPCPARWSPTGRCQPRSTARGPGTPRSGRR